MDNPLYQPKGDSAATMDLVLCGHSIFDEKEFAFINNSVELKGLFQTVARQVEIGFHLETQRMLFQILERTEKRLEAHRPIFKLLLFSYLTAGFYYYKSLQRDLAVRALSNIHMLLGLNPSYWNWIFPSLGLRKILRSDEGTKSIVTVTFFLLSCLYLKKGDLNQAYYYQNVLKEMPGKEAELFSAQLLAAGDHPPRF